MPTFSIASAIFSPTTVAVGRNDADLGDLVRAGDGLGSRFQILHDFGYGKVDAALEVHGTDSGGDRLHALADNRLREDRRGGCAVTGVIVGLARAASHHLRAHVLELVLELDLLGDGNAVLGDARSAEALFHNDVATLGAEGHSNSIGDDIHTASNSFAGVA